MKTEKGIPILEGAPENVAEVKAQYASVIAMNAFKVMTDALVRMEQEGRKPDFMMEKCVWPILHEASRRFETIANGDFDVPKDGFEFVVG